MTIIYTCGGFICTFSLLISLSFTLQTSKFRNQFTISSKYFDMICYLKREAYFFWGSARRGTDEMPHVLFAYLISVFFFGHYTAKFNSLLLQSKGLLSIGVHRVFLLSFCLIYYVILTCRIWAKYYVPLNECKIALCTVWKIISLSYNCLEIILWMKKWPYRNNCVSLFY